MKPCAAFRSVLAEAAAGPTAGLARLRADPHVAVCAECAAVLAREAALDRLLAGAPADPAPARLAARVLSGLAEERARRHATPDDADELDGLLERVPVPAAPPGLAARVLSGLASERVAPALPARRWPRVLGIAAAAAAVLGAFLWIREGRGAVPDAGSDAVAELAVLEADADLLAYAAERWELLNDADLDLWLASLDPADEILVEYADEVLWAAAAGEAR